MEISGGSPRLNVAGKMEEMRATATVKAAMAGPGKAVHSQERKRNGGGLPLVAAQTAGGISDGSWSPE